MTQPLVSVIIPCYNYGSLVGIAIESALASEYAAIEVIVVNDGSNDNSAEVLDSIALKDSRVHVFHTQNQGVEQARNLAIEKSKGEYIFTLDADDSIKPRFIPLASEILQKNLDVIYVHSDVEFTGIRHRISIGEEFEIHRFIVSNYFVNCGLFRRSSYNATPSGYITDAHLNTHEDWFFLMQLLLTGGRFYRIPEVLTVYYSKPDSKLKGAANNKALLAKVYNDAFPIQLKLIRFFKEQGKIGLKEKKSILGDVEHKLAYFNLNHAGFFWGFSLAIHSSLMKPNLLLKNLRIITNATIKRLLGLNK
jgi:glycosyltransferase involved in cell wall biosynthesis